MVTRQWQPIETAPKLDRVLVCGWQPLSGTVDGYWWWHVDVIADGRPLEHRAASHWFPIELPDFPEAPQ